MIPFTRIHGAAVLVNPHLVTHVNVTGEGTVTIHLMGGHPVHVREPLAEVQELLDVHLGSVA